MLNIFASNEKAATLKRVVEEDVEQEARSLFSEGICMGSYQVIDGGTHRALAACPLFPHVHDILVRSYPEVVIDGLHMYPS